jgi:ParB-like chromosome segregation protein Spo0J
MAKHRTVDIDELVCDPENARTHDDRNMDAIAKSLKRFGPGRSIVVDRNNIIRAGNGTVEAARAAGFKKVTVIEPDEDTLVAVQRSSWEEKQAKGYAIADNRAAELAKWELPTLHNIIESMSPEETEDAGFLPADLEKLFGEFDIPPAGMPDLPNGEPEHTQITFLFTASEAAVVGEALARAVGDGLCEPGKKGTAMAAICGVYLEG